MSVLFNIWSGSLAGSLEVPDGFLAGFCMPGTGVVP